MWQCRRYSRFGDGAPLPLSDRQVRLSFLQSNIGDVAFGGNYYKNTLRGTLMIKKTISLNFLICKLSDLS